MRRVLPVWVVLWGGFWAACADEAVVPCTEHATCTPLGQFCIDGECRAFSGKPDLAAEDLTGTLVDLSGCVSSSSCFALTAPICDAVTHACRACKAGECPSALPFCMADGKCAGCVNETDCASSQGYCDANQRCGPCTRGADCRSDVCDQGKCIAEMDVVYVDNAASCADDDGTRLHPYCELADGVTAGKRYVKVAGSAVDYPALDVPADLDREVVLVGPGTTAAQAATLSSVIGNALRVAPAAMKEVTLTIEGFILRGVPSAALPVVDCAAMGGTASLTMRDVIVYNSGGPGIVTNACSLVLTRARIGANGGVGVQALGPAVVRQSEIRGNKGGLSLGDSFTVENNVVAENPGAPGVSISGAATGTFRFNTIVGNGDGTGASGGGVQANGAPVTIEASIIIGNTKGSSNTQFVNCTLLDTVTGADGAPGAIQKTPTWLAQFDYHLTDAAANFDCCIDQLTAGPATDRDGTARPRRNGYDVGAYELP